MGTRSSCRAQSSESGPDPTVLDDLERDLVVSCPLRIRCTQVDVSSGDEPLVRPDSGGHVVPRMGERHHEEAQDDQFADVAISEPGATVVGSPGASFAAGVLGGADLVPIAGGVKWSHQRLVRMTQMGFGAPSEQ